MASSVIPKGERVTPEQISGVCPSLDYRSITYFAPVSFAFFEVSLFLDPCRVQLLP